MSDILVSVVVISYNSGKTIKKTLDSILEQSYGSNNIELIISDDFSDDDTIDNITAWISSYGEHFFNVIFNVNDRNLGIPKNVNVAWQKATTEWIKTIAGDDFLHADCIKYYINEVKKNKGEAYFSYMQSFIEINNEIVLGNLFPDKNQVQAIKNGLKCQKKYLMRHCFSVAPSSFIKKTLLEKIGYADEDFHIVEDYPLWINIVNNDIPLKFMDQITVFYRIGESASRSNSRIINLDYCSDLMLLEKKYIIPLLHKNRITRLRKMIWSRNYKRVILLFNNKKTIISKVVLAIFNSLFKPGYLSRALRLRCE